MVDYLDLEELPFDCEAVEKNEGACKVLIRAKVKRELDADSLSSS